MLRLKVLKGTEIKSYDLHDGVNTVGRLESCDVFINSNGVSKKHAQLIVKDSICSVTDLGSSNGTFVNGTKVKDRILKLGDRIGFHNVIVELRADALPAATPESFAFQPETNQSGSLAHDLGLSPQSAPVTQPKNLTETISYYFENIVMPGIYKINEVYPTKNILAALILIFAFVVTLLSTIPMSAMMKDSIQKEAQRRALTIAKQLAEASERALATTSDTIIRTDFAESEDGVISALVVSKEDGHIIAPISKGQSYSSEEFVARARKHDDIYVDQTSTTMIGASVPGKLFSTETGQLYVTAQAIILYKMSTLDWNATVGIFARVLLISLLVGFFIFIFMYKIITEPLRQANLQLDKVLRGEGSMIESKFSFGTFNHLLNNVNSALARIGSPAESQMPIFDKNSEGSNIIRILRDPAICIGAEGKIISVNPAFEELVNQRLASLQEQSLSTLQDQALHLNIEDLFQKAIQMPQQISSGQLEINGALYEIDSQAITDSKKVLYVVVTVKRRLDG